MSTGDDRPLRMNAYYYSFEPTGVRVIDEILSAVACAGKAYHHTEYWSDTEGGGQSCVDLIQEAAARAAASFPPASCGCAETYPQLVPGTVSHGPGCVKRASRDLTTAAREYTDACEFAESTSLVSPVSNRAAVQNALTALEQAAIEFAATPHHPKERT